jgi:hypothetical protein
VGEEFGKQTNYHHLQSFRSFTTTKSAPHVKQKRAKEAHVEKTDGSTASCIQYGMKDGKILYQKNVEQDKPMNEKKRVDKMHEY